ncbi:hypothetical protein F2P81_010806 [Scophthalmus maximus]|uniref:Uncharacterized protein n=1 Tax=Scophthalmus maximus TaxID=52904 RepID=A0A6A4T6W4_SCOMX|nr:hypothetical protein F2P81_010806 [Scophthalmus maximus]
MAVRSSAAATLAPHDKLFFNPYPSLHVNKCVVRYSCNELLNIGKHQKFALAPELSTVLGRLKLSRTAEWCTRVQRLEVRRKRYACRQKRGKRSGLFAKLKASNNRRGIPSLFLANVCSLDNKMDLLRLRLSTYREMGNCCVFLLTESWLNNNKPDSASQLDGLQLFRADRNQLSGKSRGGGLCVYINKDSGHFTTNDPRSMWKGIKTITDFNKRDAECPVDPSLPDALNTVYARFKAANNTPCSRLTLPPGELPLSVTTADVRRSLLKVNPCKAAGPNNIPGRVLRDCAHQLSDVLKDISNTLLSQQTVPTCFKTATIIPVPKSANVSCLNVYRPVALTPIIMKCFERLVMSHIKDHLDPSVDPHQYAYRQNRSTDDAISAVVHLALSHLENRTLM